MGWDQYKLLDERIQSIEKKFEGISNKINGEEDSSIADLLYAMDYKDKGTESPVYAEKDKLHHAYMTWYGANSSYYKEALTYANSINQVGYLLSKREDLKPLAQLQSYKNFAELQFSDDLEIIDHLNSVNGLLRFLVNDKFITETNLTPAEIKALYYDKDRTDCDPNFPQVIYNNYVDEFADSYENIMIHYQKPSFWKPRGCYFDSQEWLQKVYDTFNRDYAIQTKTVAVNSRCSSSGRYDQTDKGTTGVRVNGSFDLPENGILLKISTNVSLITETSGNYYGNTMGYAGDNFFGQILYSGNIWGDTPQTASRSSFTFILAPHTFTNYTDPFAYSGNNYYSEQRGTTESTLLYVIPD